jgi:hypothetical protein
MHCSFRETKPSYDPYAVAANFMLAGPPETMAEATALLRPPDFAATSFLGGDEDAVPRARLSEPWEAHR